MKYGERESSTLELKRELPKSDQIIKTVIGFCNQNGGKLVIGVDNNGTIVGMAEGDIQQAMEYLDKSIHEASQPPIIPQIYAQTIGSKTILIIEVCAGMNKPYFKKSDGLDKGTYIRLGRSTLLANADMIEELKWQSRGKSFDMMPVYQATVEDLDVHKIKEFLTQRKINIGAQVAVENALDAYNLVAHEHAHQYPTVAGILVCAKDPQRFLNQAFIICTQFAGISGREALSSLDCTGTLVNQFYEAYNFILSKLQRSFVIEGPKRAEQLEIPEIALREILINAIVHRNYHIQAPIKIALFDNRIEIFSPGGFPGPLTPDTLLCGLTYIRNLAITKLLRHLGLIETLGTGFLTLFESYRERGLPTPQVTEGENYVKCILPRKQMREQQTPETTGIESDLHRIMQLLDTSPEITIVDVIEQLHLSRATAGRRLSLLVFQKLIKKIGSGKAARYVKT